MKTQSYDVLMTTRSGVGRIKARAQQGVVLFIALIALLVMSLAAVALIRSVDTGTMISGNLSFRQSATTSSDVGIEAAVTALDCRGRNVLFPTPCTTSNPIDPRDPRDILEHPFNVSSASAGYYSNADTRALTSDASWTDTNSVLVGTENGNTVRYIIERMCRPADIETPVDQVLSDAFCLLSDGDTNTSSKAVLAAPEAGGKKASNPPMYRITIRTTGPKNTVSYVQAFAY